LLEGPIIVEFTGNAGILARVSICRHAEHQHSVGESSNEENIPTTKDIQKLKTFRKPFDVGAEQRPDVVCIDLSGAE